jgi:hypothetical protein
MTASAAISSMQMTVRRPMRFMRWKVVGLQQADDEEKPAFTDDLHNPRILRKHCQTTVNQEQREYPDHDNNEVKRGKLWLVVVQHWHTDYQPY